MHGGFYTSIERGTKRGLLLGPFASYEVAEACVPEARRLAADVDPFADFDGYGVTFIEYVDERIALPRSVFGIPITFLSNLAVDGSNVNGYM